jgi:hypothetical protein
MMVNKIVEITTEFGGSSFVDSIESSPRLSRQSTIILNRPTAYRLGNPGSVIADDVADEFSLLSQQPP